jgi:acyl carrier protein
LEEEDTSEVTDTTRVYPELDRWHTNDSQLDTLSFVELIVSVEEKFDIDICDSEAEKIKTFKDLVDCVEMLVKSH